MKKHKLKITLNEIKRMQQLAGIKLEENDAYDYFFGDDDSKSNSTSLKNKKVPSLEDLERKMEDDDSLNLIGSDIEALPEGLEVDGDLRLVDCKSLKELPNNFKVGGILDLEGCTSLKKLPQGLEVGWDLSSKKGRYLNLEGCTSLEELPKGLKVGGGLFLNNCKSLKELPQNLQVGGDFFIRDTPIEKIPQGLEVGKGLFVINTPIAKKYSKDEIRKIIENGGGFVKGNVF